MRKIVLSFVVFSLFVARVFANGDEAVKVQALINKGLFKNKAEIVSLASSLSLDEKEVLIDRNRITGYFPMYMNSGFGFGIGSFIAKDYIGGAVHCSIDLACNVIMISMFATYSRAVFGAAEGRNGLDDIYYSVKKYLITGIATAFIVVINRVAQIISLAIHVHRYNATLAEVLASGSSSSTEKAAVSLVPILDENKFGLGLNFAIPKKSC